MTLCPQCRTENPDQASYCMHCGQPLAMKAPDQKSANIWHSNLLLLAGSLALSLILFKVFRLPVFILAGFLPLFWRRRRPN